MGVRIKKVPLLQICGEVKMIKTILSKKFFRALLVAAALAFVLFAGALFYCYFDALTGSALGDGGVGIRTRDVTWVIDGKEHKIAAYRSLGKMNVIFLVGAPSSSPAVVLTVIVWSKPAAPAASV